jgi:hypothetical protein
MAVDRRTEANKRHGIVAVMKSPLLDHLIGEREHFLAGFRDRARLVTDVVTTEGGARRVTSRWAKFPLTERCHCDRPPS